MQALKTTFTLPEYLVQELAVFSKELSQKKSHIVAEALSQYFDTLDLNLAKKRAQEVKDGIVQTVSLDEIKEELGL